MWGPTSAQGVFAVVRVSSGLILLAFLVGFRIQGLGFRERGLRGFGKFVQLGVLDEDIGHTKTS